MPKYQFKALDHAGRKVQGIIEAKDRDQVKQQVRGMRQHLISLKLMVDTSSHDPSTDDTPIVGNLIFRDGNGQVQISLGSEKPTTKDLIIFTKQFATMLQSGVSLTNSLTLLGGQQRSRRFRKAIYSIRNNIENGSKMSEAMEAYPAFFDSLYISMLRAGEVTGGLDRILIQLTTYIERQAKIQGQIKKALTYPTLVAIVAVGVITALLTFVVPAMAENFKDGGKELPWLTKFVMELSDKLQDSFMMIIFALVAMGLFFKIWKNSEKGNVQFDSILINSPILGPVLKKIAVSRFCTTMSSMMSSGVNLLEGLSICASSSGNKIIERFVIAARDGVEKGQRLSEQLKKGKIFPDLVISMIMVGEETGKIDEMLTKIAEFYDEEVEVAIGAMLSLIEPIMLVVIGAVVAVILLAMYLPMFEMAGNV